MNTNWNKRYLGDLIDIRGGLSYKTSEIGRGEKKLLGMGCVSFDKRFLESGCRQFCGEGKPHHLVTSGDLVIATRQQSDNLPILGFPAQIPNKLSSEKIYVGTNLYKIENNSEYSNSFLYWLMRGNIYRQHVKANASGSTVRMITKDVILNFEFNCPSVQESIKIAEFLDSLEDKIELNQKTNETLEGIAKAIFKSWFIDFDPVRAKSEGRSTGLPNEISDLFPDSLDNSELGQLPKGWVVTNLGDCSLQIESGKRPKGGINKELQNGIPSIGAESIDSAGIFDFSKTKFVTHDFASSSKKGWVKNLDVAVYKDGGKPGEFKPRVAIYGENYPFDSFMVNEHVFLIRSEILGQPFLYHLMNAHVIREQIIQMGSSKGAQPGLNQEEVKSTIFPKSNNLLTSKFNKISTPIINKQLTLGKQNIYLENLRNAILPKLISGELRIPDAERMIEEAGI